MTLRALPLFALLVGCVDYRLSGSKPANDATDTATPFIPDTANATDTGLCTDPSALEDGVAVDETCLAIPTAGTLDTRVEWTLTNLLEYREYGHVLMAPVVGPLSDLDGDGDVDADDPPSIVVVTDDGGADGANTHGVLRVIDGRDGTPLHAVSTLLWGETQVYPYRYSGAALADLDGDGTPEIVIVVTVSGAPHDGGGGDGTDTGEPGDPEEDDSGIVVRPSEGERPPSGAQPPAAPAPSPCRVAAYTPDGALKWLAEEPAIECGGHAPALADLEGDGTVEVIVGANIYAGATGEWRATGALGGGRPSGFPEAGWMSFGADIDGDGMQEVIAGDAMYAADGSTRCATGEDDGYPAVADLDGVGYGELVVVSNGWLRVYAGDCSRRMRRRLVGDGFGGPPTIGDLDGDGTPEIGIANADYYTAYEANGIVLWSAPISDWSSSSSAASFYDFDGDGQLEVVYADETTLWIFDGATGAVRLEDDTHSSRTLHEMPVVVDIDADGMAEILVPNGGAHSDEEAVGLYVLGSANDDWVSARRVWNQHAYAITNIDDNLGVPAHPLPNWPTWNTFRSGALDPVAGGATADAVPIVEVCDACALGVFYVDVAVGNQGMAGLRAGVPVSVYADGGLLATQWTSGVVASGGVSETLRFELDSALTTGEINVVVDDDGRFGGRVFECSETNNVTVEAGCE